MKDLYMNITEDADPKKTKINKIYDIQSSTIYDERYVNTTIIIKSYENN
jgi:hypothetical protein